jgi:alkylhydroperoxidase family enzyme
LKTLIDKVATRAHTVTDEDIVAARASGLSEDQIFELVVCAAIGQATRQYDTALAVLVVATTKPRNDR